ncbi:MAG: M20/M25/M40 family metallo-hydrolase [Chloroflexota bacterium]
MGNRLSESVIKTIIKQVNQQRIIDTAIALIEIPSPTRSAGAVSDKLAEILTAAGFTVERPVAGWPEAPAVVVRHDTGKPGRTLQFDGHLDTVHLPFVPPRLENGYLYGSGSSDMKGGIAAFVEALRVLKETDSLPAGSILLTAHDHHEGPWGDRRQVKALIREGYIGDAVMLPEYLASHLPLSGRGMGIFEIAIRREGEPMHEVQRPPNLPDVIGAGTKLVQRLQARHEQIKTNVNAHGAHDSVFIGQLTAGEIYNQAPIECQIKGTRRWITPGQTEQVTTELQQMLADLAGETGTEIDLEISVQGDAFQLEVDNPIVEAFQAAHTAVTGTPLPVGAKPFVDDGHAYAALANIPPLTHGPDATGAHTLNEQVPVSELVRVAQVYALTAIGFCQE